MSKKRPATTVRIRDDQHEWLKKNHPGGFSRIVRAHLDELMHQETPVGFHNAWRESAQKCYPYMRGGYCSICWPAGIPSRNDWSDYIKSGFQDNPGAPGTVTVTHKMTFEEWSSLRHQNRQTILDEWNRDSSTYHVANEERTEAISSGSKPKSGWIRRFFRQFF